MPVSHLLFALAAVAVWGTNFVVIKWGLATWPPLLFVALRYALSSLPLLVLARPRVSWGLIAGYGLLIGVGQFGLLFYAIKSDITPGLASLVVQMQVFFTIAMSGWLFGEKLRPLQSLALALAIAGIGLIAWHVSAPSTGATTTLRGIGLVLLAAACWALSNLVVKHIGRIDMLAFIAWSSIVPTIALAVLSVVLEGREQVATAFAHAGTAAWIAVLWQALGNTLFGFAAWSWLLARHPAASVTPMALLVPVFGMGASAWLLGEPLPAWKLIAAALVLGGLGLNVWAGRLAAAEARAAVRRPN